MKKIISSFLLAVMLLTSPLRGESEAVVAPIVIGAVIAGTVILVAAGIRYSRPATPPAVSNFCRLSGAITAALVATWSRLATGLNGGTEVVSKPIVGTINNSDLKSVVQASSSSYPLLNGALTNSGYAGYTALSATVSNADNFAIGAKLSFGSKCVTVTGRSIDWGGVRIDMYSGPLVTDTGTSFNVYHAYSNGGVPMYNISTYSYHVETTPPVTYTDATIDDFRARINGSADSYSGEINNCIASNPNIVHFEDTGTAEETAGPPLVINPVQTALSPSTTDNAKSRLAAAQSAVATAQSDYDSNPNPATLAALQAAQQALTAAQASLNNATAQNDEVYPSTTAPPYDSLNFEAWKGLRNLMGNVWPFTLIMSLPDMLSQFTAIPQAPVFTLPIGSQNATVNLSCLDPVAAFIRWAFSILMSIAVLQTLLKWWRG